MPIYSGFLPHSLTNPSITNPGIRWKNTTFKWYHTLLAVKNAFGLHITSFNGSSSLSLIPIFKIWFDVSANLYVVELYTEGSVV